MKAITFGLFAELALGEVTDSYNPWNPNTTRSKYVTTATNEIKPDWQET
jgi:hypothetical protein